MSIQQHIGPHTGYRWLGAEQVHTPEQIACAVWMREFYFATDRLALERACFLGTLTHSDYHGVWCELYDMLWSCAGLDSHGNVMDY